MAPGRAKGHARGGHGRSAARAHLMAVIYPLALPTTPNFNRATLRLRTRTAITVSEFTGQQQVVAHAGAWWEAILGLPPMTRAEAEPWLGMLLALNGRVGTFRFGDPFGTTPQGVATGTPLVFGAGQIGKTLQTDGWTPNITGILKAGDYLQIVERLYKVVQDANSNASGQATLEIQPSLRESPVDNAAITITNTTGLFRLQSNQEAAWELDTDKVYHVAFAAVEAL